MATATVTRKSVIAKAIVVLKDVWSEEELEVLQKMLNSLEKPAKKAEGPTKNQVMNLNLAASLIEEMRKYGQPVSAKWIADNVSGINTPQKAVAVIKAAGEQIVKFYEKRQALYRLA